MNRRLLLEAGCWSIALAAALWSGGQWRHWQLPVVAGPPSAGAPPAVPRPVSASPDTGSTNLAAVQNPFRLDRRPRAATAETDPADPVPAEPDWAPEHDEDAPVLRGLLSGPPWLALLEGVPGHPGSALVQAGDTLGAVRVQRIDGHVVVLQDATRTWTLTLEVGWPVH